MTRPGAAPLLGLHDVSFGYDGPAVLEQVFGAQMDVLQHLGMLVVVDGRDPRAVAG